jgi:TetR/AcrR family transcriptional regulator
VAAAVDHPTKDRILKKSLSLFSSKGYAGTSVREICESSGITKPTLYYFFGNKEGLFRALVDESLDRFTDQLTQVLSGEGTCVGKLKRMARYQFAVAHDHKALARFIVALVHSRPSSAPTIDFERFYTTITTLVSTTLDEAVRTEHLRPGSSSLRTLVLLGALGEAMNVYLLSGQLDLTSELADSLIDTILEGWSHT